MLQAKRRPVYKALFRFHGRWSGGGCKHVLPNIADMMHSELSKVCR